MSSDEDTRKKTIAEILTYVGLGQYGQVFEENMINIENVEYMSDDDFSNLGITVIGIRLKIKQACLTYLKGVQSSPVISKFKELVSKRQRKMKRNEPKNEKPTRRIYVGWKHLTSNVYKIVTVKDGGGQQVIDVNKDSDLEQLKEIILNIYFPNGRSEVKCLELNELGYFIASFSGQQLPGLEEFGGFTVGSYCRFVKSSPVRLYLHTFLNEARLQNSGFSNNTEMSTTSVNKDLNPPTTIQEQQHPSQFFHRESQLKAPQEPRDDLDTDSDSSFEMLGTPTLRIRRCLSLRRPESNANCPGTSTSSCVETASRDEDIVELVDSEDEDIARAIEASLAEYNDVRSGEPKLPCDPAPVLQKYQMEAVSHTATRSTVIVSHRHVLKSAFSALERKTFSMNGTLYVKFSGEIGEDHGGPRREFLRLAMRELQSSNLFEGPDNSRYFSHNLELLNTDQYHLAGRLMALSLAHNGPGFHCMNPVLYDYIATGNGSMENFDPSVLPSDIRDVIEQLKTIETEIDRDRFLSEHGDWLIGQGIQNIYRLSSSSKDEVSVMLQKQYLFYRTAAEITQFTTGLNELNLWNYVKKEPESFKPLFCYAPKPLTKETFFELCQPNFLDVGSNKRADEMDTIYSWELFLQDVEEGIVPVSFEELLAFITGANAVPPCGFSKKLDIQFYSQEGHVRLPFVSTCSLEMWLPRSANQQELSRLIVRALKESQGFLKV